MKKTFIYFSSLLLLAILFGNCFAQDNTSGTVKGIVLDKTTNSPLESVAIRIIKSDDSTLLKGTSTDADGKFSIGEIPFGLYTVRVSLIGYNNAVAKNVVISSEKKLINFGTIKLEVRNETTEEITVVDDAPTMTFEEGKKIYNVEKDFAAKSGSVLDLLKNIPSVDVDNDGNVSLRGGGNVKILIDGKESALLSNGNQALQNISANTVEKIEVINNPSAKYEAEGISGILNIIIKKGQNIGYNGNFRLNTGTKDKYNFSTGGSLKKGNYSLSGNYGFWNFYNPGHSEVNRTSFQSIESRTTEQDIYWYFKGIGHFGSLGADYEINKLNNLTFTGNVFYHRSDFGKDNYDNFYSSNGILTKYFHNYNNVFTEGFSMEGMLSYNKKYEEKGRELTIQTNYSNRYFDNPIDYRNYNPDNSIYFTRADYNTYFNFLNSQADYIHPIGEKTKLEAGLRGSYRNVDADYKYLLFDNNTNQWAVYQNRENNILFKDFVAASYATFSGKYKDFSYNLGLRGEYYLRDFSLKEGQESYNEKYFDLFPNINLTQSINKENSIQGTYSRRINRPNLYFLNPFIFQNDKYIKRAGNPYLNPEYVNSFELGYTRYLSFATLTLSGYFRNILDNINMIKTIDTNGAIFTTYKNTGTSNTYGLEFIMQLSPAKWWNINGSLSYYYNRIFNNDNSSQYDNSYRGFSSRITSNMNIPDLFDIQIQYNYFGVRLTPQGKYNPLHYLSASIQKSFLDKKLTLGLRLRDIFDQEAHDLVLETNEFSQIIYEKGHSRVLTFTLSFNFGEQFNTNSQRNIQRRQREAENEIQQ